MRAALAGAALLLSACTQPQPADTQLSSILPVQPVDPVVQPVTFADLRGQSVMVLDRTEPDFAVGRIASYLRECKTAAGERVTFDPHGLRLIGPDGVPLLILMVAQRGPVTGIALDGPDFSPLYQEELAQAVEGRSSCA